MTHCANTELADMHLIYGLAEGNARAAQREPSNHRMFANLHRHLYEYLSLRGNGTTDLPGTAKLATFVHRCHQGCGSPEVRVSDHGRRVMSSSPVPLKTRQVGQRCTLNMSRAETSFRWCGVVVRRGGCQFRCRPPQLTMVQNYVVRHQKLSCS
ncbi:uncharacterized protein TNCV_106291 [Trichonephila clavipes]|nr:uncharacterized protein TNCV_106291 [Trichonephila clavipes]